MSTSGPGDKDKEGGARRGSFAREFGGKVATKVGAGLQRRGSAAMASTAESLASFVGASSGALKGFADWASKKMKAIHGTFSSLKEELEKAKTAEGKEKVMEKAAEVAAEAFIDGLFQTGQKLTQKQKAGVRASMRVSVRQSGIAGLESDLHDALQAAAEGKQVVNEDGELEEHSGMTEAPPPVPGERRSSVGPAVPSGKPTQAMAAEAAKRHSGTGLPPVAPKAKGPVLGPDGKPIMPARPKTTGAPKLPTVAEHRTSVSTAAPVEQQAPMSEAAKLRARGVPITSEQYAMKHGVLTPVKKGEEGKQDLKHVSVKRGEERSTTTATKQPNAMQAALAGHKGLKKAEKGTTTPMRDAPKDDNSLAAVLAKAMDNRRPAMKDHDSDDESNGGRPRSGSW